RRHARLSDVPKSTLFDPALHTLRLEVRRDAERLDHITDSNALLRPHVALAVHQHRHTRRRSDDRGSRTDDDVLRPPVVRAPDIEQPLDARSQEGRPSAYCVDVTEQLLRRLAAIPLK